MQIAIIGAGALGCLLAYFLSPYAHVTLLSSRLAHARVLAEHGIACEYDGIRERRTVRVAYDATDAEGSDIALVVVKSAQTPWAASQASTLLAPHGLAITLQNGLGNHEKLVAALGEGQVGQGVTALGATLLGPGLVRYAGSGPTTFADAPQPAHVYALARLFEDAGLPATVSSELESLVWGKLVVSCGINALSALLRVPNGRLASVGEARTLLAAAVDEAVAVARARSVALPYADPLAHVLSVAEATAANYSSMLQDVLQGRPTEIASINGALVREGQRLGIATPINQLLTELVQALDATANPS